jgi:hypothetical protein
LTDLFRFCGFFIFRELQGIRKELSDKNDTASLKDECRKQKLAVGKKAR